MICGGCDSYEEDCECWEEIEPDWDWIDFAAKANEAFTSAYNRITAALITAQLPWPKPYLRGPLWWVPFSPLPSGLNVRIESHWQERDFTFQSSTKRVLEDSETIWVELGGQRWIATRVEWSCDPDNPNIRELTGVLASQPPGFGHWMPSLRSLW